MRSRPCAHRSRSRPRIWPCDRRGRRRSAGGARGRNRLGRGSLRPRSKVAAIAPQQCGDRGKPDQRPPDPWRYPLEWIRPRRRSRHAQSVGIDPPVGRVPQPLRALVRQTRRVGRIHQSANHPNGQAESDHAQRPAGRGFGTIPMAGDNGGGHAPGPGQAPFHRSGLSYRTIASRYPASDCTSQQPGSRCCEKTTFCGWRVDPPHRSTRPVPLAERSNRSQSADSPTAAPDRSPSRRLVGRAGETGGRFGSRN